MMYLSEVLIDRMSNLKLFERGSSTVENVMIETCAASAIEKIKQLVWENCILDKQNEVTLYLFQHYRDMYNTLWNKIAIEVRQTLVPIFESKIEKISSEYREMKVDIIYELIMMCIYKEYNIRGCVTSEFFDEMELIFESGYVPIGYEGVFPNGIWHIY